MSNEIVAPEARHTADVSVRPCSKCDGDGFEYDHEAIGRSMARMRKESRATLREVAGLLGYSIGYVSDLEHGRKNWSLKLMNFYAAAVSTIAGERIK